MSDNYLKELFIDEAKPALQRHSGGGVSLDHTVTFMADDKPYEIVSVKDGNAVNAPATNPASEAGSFSYWALNGSVIGFPYIPTENIGVVAVFINLCSDAIYKIFNVDKNEHPYLYVQYSKSYRAVEVIFAETFTPQSYNDKMTGCIVYKTPSGTYPTSDNISPVDLVKYISNNFAQFSKLEDTEYKSVDGGSHYGNGTIEKHSYFGGTFANLDVEYA